MVESCTLPAAHPFEGSSLNRFPGPLLAANAGDEGRPSVSGDGSTIVFLSDGRLDPTEPAPPPTINQVWAAVLGPSSVSVNQVTDYEEDPLHDPVTPTLASAQSASITDGSETVVLAVATAGAPRRRDLRLVNLEVGEGAGLQARPPSGPGPVRPAALPFEVELLTCSGDGDEVSVELSLAQFRGGARQLVIALEVEDAMGTVHRRAPFVQPLIDEAGANLTEPIDSDIVAGTCRVAVHDGATTSIDRVTDALAFTAP